MRPGWFRRWLDPRWYQYLGATYPDRVAVVAILGDYIERKRAEGKSRREAIRRLNDCSSAASPTHLKRALP